VKASRLKKVNSKNHKIEEWMTNDNRTVKLTLLTVLTSDRRKNDLSKKIKKHQSNLNVRRFYNICRNKFNTIVRLAKINLKKKKFSKVQRDPKRTWNLVNEIIGVQNSKNFK